MACGAGKRNGSLQIQIQIPMFDASLFALHMVLVQLCACVTCVCDCV